MIKIRYIKQLNAIITTSNHPDTAICLSPMPDIGDHFSMVGSRAQSAKKNAVDIFKPALNYIPVSTSNLVCIMLVLSCLDFERREDFFLHQSRECTGDRRD